MPPKQYRQLPAGVKEALEGDADFLRPMVLGLVQEVLEREMDKALGAGRFKLSEGRPGYRNVYYPRGLVTRVGRIELRVPQDREGRISTEVSERDQRSEKALVAALAEMYVQVGCRCGP